MIETCENTGIEEDGNAWKRPWTQVATEWIFSPGSAVPGTDAAPAAALWPYARLYLSERAGYLRAGKIDPSAVYRMLRDMEERGWVLSTWEEERTQGPPRRVYSLTALGNEVLGWWMSDLRETAESIGHLLDSYGRHMKEGAGDYH